MRRKRPIRGFSMIEGLIAALVIGVGIMGVMNLWGFVANLSVRTDLHGVGYNVARRTIEKVRAAGFNGVAEGTTTTYFDASGTTQLGSSTGARFEVRTTCTSDKIASTGRPAGNALRAIVVTVIDLNDNQTVETAGTYLCRGGV